MGVEQGKDGMKQLARRMRNRLDKLMRKNECDLEQIVNTELFFLNVGREDMSVELQVFCENCDLWWYTRCTRTASCLCKDRLKKGVVCSECVPDQ